MDDLESKVIASLEEAEIGRVVWVYHSERPRHEDGKYAGRGVWIADTITSGNRVTLEVRGAKFDRKTGYGRPHRGFSTKDRIAGARERELFNYEKNRWHIAEKVRSADLETLKRIADLVGWKP